MNLITRRTRATLIGVAMGGLSITLLALGMADDASAAPRCPSSWPAMTRVEHTLSSSLSFAFEGPHTDTAGVDWYVIASTDSNGYKTARTYAADDRYAGGYDPELKGVFVVMRSGTPTADPGCVKVRNAAEPPPSKVLRVMSGSFSTLDPHQRNAPSHIVREVFSGLVRLSPNLTALPDLAERWTLSEDRLTHTFHLDPDARFHDGRAVTAHDVKWSLERATDPDNYLTDMLLARVAGIDDPSRDNQRPNGITVVDDHTVRLHLTAPDANLLLKLTYRSTFIVDRHNVASGPDWWREPNGTGPFRLSRFTPVDALMLARNDEYHGIPAGVDLVRLDLCRDCDRIEMYEAGQLDVAKVPWREIGDYEASGRTDFHRDPPYYHTKFYVLNEDTPPLDDRNVRLALNYGLDRERIPSNTLTDVPAFGIIPPTMTGHDPNLSGYRYDPDRAVALLASSKYGPDLSTYPPIVFETSWEPTNNQKAVLGSGKSWAFRSSWTARWNAALSTSGVGTTG